MPNLWILRIYVYGWIVGNSVAQTERPCRARQGLSTFCEFYTYVAQAPLSSF